MADSSAIEWTDATWNPITGCSKVSPGCAHCYAETLTMRYAKGWKVPGLPWTPANAAENVVLKPQKLDEPRKWKKPRRVFVNSMSDLFHEQVPREFIDRVFATMALCPQHVFQVLTKRPERMCAYFEEGKPHQRIGYAMRDFHRYTSRATAVEQRSSWPLPNVWLGTSIENRRFVGRADALRATPAAVRFISAEPLLGPLVPDVGIDSEIGELAYDGKDASIEKRQITDRYWSDGHQAPGLDLTDIDWLIVGGESAGPGPRRLTDVGGPKSVARQWIGDLRDAAQAAGTAFFFKQWGGRTPKSGGRLLDGREWNEMPVAKVPGEGGVPR